MQFRKYICLVNRAKDILHQIFFAIIFFLFSFIELSVAPRCRKCYVRTNQQHLGVPLCASCQWSLGIGTNNQVLVLQPVRIETRHPPTQHTIANILKMCPVCGDQPMKGPCYGVIACKACSRFFGRCANNAPRLFQCAGKKGTCKINKRTRKLCKHCRLKKCIQVGMQHNVGR